MSAIFGEILVIEQESGPPIQLVVWGDEFYVRYETLDGYSVCYDAALGRFCYADVQDGRFVSTSAPIDKRPPLGLRRHLQESDGVRRARFDQRYGLLRPRETSLVDAERNFTFAPNQGLLDGRRVSEGNVTGLTVLVAFTDVRAAVDADDVNAMLSGENYRAHGNFSSVREYYRLVSVGKLDYQNVLVGPIQLPHTKKHYETTSLVPEAFALAMEELDARGFDLSELDSRNEGIIDAVNFMYAGATVYGVNGNNNNPSELWPHNSVRELNHDGYRTHFYMLSSMGRRSVDLSIGTFCHESGHLLCRFPDLYDYGRRDGDNLPSRGIGRYCLMGGGNHLNRGRTPSPVCAYLRDLVGWVDTEISLNGPGPFEAEHGAYGTVLKFRTGKPNEYFLIENRAQLGLDEHLPDSGLAVYQCDVNGSNEWQAGTASRHYQVALLQADGRRDLEANLPSDAGDLFDRTEGVALSAETTPSTREWDGSDSGLVVSGIGEPAEIIRFDVGAVEVPGMIRGDVVPFQLIPDDNREGIRSEIELDAAGVVTSVSVDVDITHTYIGDLEVTLIAPSGEQVVLHNRGGRWQDDIRATYTESNASLAELKGAPVGGTWALRVRDLEGQDIGRLNSWAVEIGFETTDRTLSFETESNRVIPDASTLGEESTIEVDGEGELKDIRVRVEIEHSYIGDLFVEIVAPSGHSAALHARTGWGRDDLRVTYDRTLAPALEGLIGESIQGDWTLRVLDLAPRDVGRLERWGLKLSVAG